MTQTRPKPVPMTRRCPLAPPDEYAQLREETPVSEVALPDGNTGWLVTRFEDVTTVLVHPDVSAQRKFQTSVTSVTLSPEEYLASGFGVSFIGMDPPDHTHYRKLMTGMFTVKRLKSLVPRIEKIVDDQLDVLVAGGSPADLITDFATPVPSLVICELLGMPYEDSKLFQERTHVIMSLERTKEGLLDAMTGMSDDMRALVHEKRAHPDGRLMSNLIEAVPDDGVPLTDDELVAIGNLMMIAGYETTANMIGLGALTLLHYREQWETLCRQPELAERAVEEILRYLTVGPFCLPRTAKTDLELGGKHIRAGDPILLSTESANWDPAQFEHPEAFDVTRKPKRHVGFAFGAHQCLGQELARMEMRIAFAKLAQRLPGLRLAVPLEEIPMRTDMQIYGAHEVPVVW
ncbi:cytochrome P450 [Amycolatopsis sp. NBC_01307]|uniref:cytochrome P450 n=1 Tax=Amycolatopsis sp. NBC_01307 TaxID=2903561 RepID=UPI002E113B3B|nr:cytochrome P450 [Amycolatopsis sp. NBC_01307]